MNIFKKLFGIQKIINYDDPINTNKLIYLDAEDLAEGSIKEYYDKIGQILRTEFKITFMEISQTISDKYELMLNNKTISVYNEHQLQHDNIWELSTVVFFNIINDQLNGIDLRLYAINGGNDLMGILLSEKEYKYAMLKIENKLDLPYIPKIENIQK